MQPLIDWTKPLVSVLGYPARLLCADRKFKYDPRLTHVVLIDDPEHGEQLLSTDIFGIGLSKRYAVVNKGDADV